MGLLGILLFLYEQLSHLDLVPGLHFDEAWAANFAVRIATEPGFWPLHAQSPYTMPWAHYFAALWLQIFGISLTVFRASQVFLALLGWIGFAYSLFLVKRSRLVCYLPWLLLIFPGILVNQRFAIELTGFHVFCAGQLAIGLACHQRYEMKSAARLICLLSILLGVSAHVIFLALPFSLFFLRLSYYESLHQAFSKTDRKWIASAALLLIPFFARIFVGVPEKGKALALVIGMAIFAIWVLLGGPFWQRFVALSSFFKYAFYLVSGVFLFNALFFLEGHWGVLQQIGELQVNYFFGLGLVLFITLFFLQLGRDKISTDMQIYVRWSLILCLFLGCLMLKPAPRYFHLAFFPLILIGAHLLLGLRPIWRVFFVGFLTVHLGASVTANYFLPAVYGNQVDQPLRVLFFKDSSRDFLSKQHVARMLGDLGCGMDRVESDDARVVEALRFLQHGDWHLRTSTTCPVQRVRVSRAEAVLAKPEIPSAALGARVLRHGFYLDLYSE